MEEQSHGIPALEVAQALAMPMNPHDQAALQLGHLAHQRAMVEQAMEQMQAPPQPDEEAAADSNLKYCRACGEMKLRKEYHRNHSKADELEDVCKPCKAARDAARRRGRAGVVPSVASKVCKKCAEEKPAGEFPRNKLTNDGLHSYCKRCKLQMDSASREKRKRMEGHANRRAAPASTHSEAAASAPGLPGNGLPGPALGHLQQLQQLPVQHYCDACKQFCAAQEHADGPEMPHTMRCTACGSVAVPIDPAAAMSTGEPAPVEAMQTQTTAGLPTEDAAQLARMDGSTLSALLTDPANLQQAVQSKTCEACGLEKSASQFVPNRASKDGLARHCQDCAAAGADAPGGPAGGPAAPLRRPGRRARTPAAFPINEKVCRKCNVNKPAAEFPQKKSHPDGRDDYCKACHAKATAARVAARGPVKEPTVEAKVCSKCREQKAAAEFHRDCNKPDGLRGRCRTCEAEAGQARRAARTKTEAPTVAAKLCRRCGLEKPAEEFPHKAEREDGLDSFCKACNCAATADRVQRRMSDAKRQEALASLLRGAADGSSAGPHIPVVETGAVHQQEASAAAAGDTGAEHMDGTEAGVAPAVAPLAPASEAYPPAGVAAPDGTQWSANQMTEADAAMQRQLAFQAQQWMVRLQEIQMQDSTGLPNPVTAQEVPSGLPQHSGEHASQLAAHVLQAITASSAAAFSSQTAQEAETGASQHQHEQADTQEAPAEPGAPPAEKQAPVGLPDSQPSEAADHLHDTQQLPDGDAVAGAQ